MQAVYFPESFSQRAPGVVGALYTAPDCRTTNMVAVIEALQKGEAISIRQATASELKRAEALVALYEIGVMIGQKVGELLDQEPASTVVAVRTSLRDALEAENRPVDILDRTPQPQT